MFPDRLLPAAAAVRRRVGNRGRHFLKMVSGRHVSNTRKGKASPPGIETAAREHDKLSHAQVPARPHPCLPTILSYAGHLFPFGPRAGRPMASTVRGRWASPPSLPKKCLAVLPDQMSVTSLGRFLLLEGRRADRPQLGNRSASTAPFNAAGRGSPLSSKRNSQTRSPTGRGGRLLGKQGSGGARNSLKSSKWPRSGKWIRLGQAPCSPFECHLMGRLELSRREGTSWCQAPIACR